MRRMFIALLLVTTLAPVWAQQGTPRDTYSPGQASSVVPGEGLSARGSRAARANGTSQLSTTSILSFSGIGQEVVYQMMNTSNTSALVRTGATVLNESALSNLSGQSLLAAMVPMYLGGRYDWAVTRTPAFEMRQYAVGGAGPVMGVEFPQSVSLWQTLGSLGFRWGAGAFAGVGTEFHFSSGLGLSAQLEWDAIGFLSPLAGKRAFFGPSFSLGFSFAP